MCANGLRSAGIIEINRAIIETIVIFRRGCRTAFNVNTPGTSMEDVIFDYRRPRITIYFNTIALGSPVLRGRLHVINCVIVDFRSC